MKTKKELTRPFPHFKHPHEIEIIYEVIPYEDCAWYNVPSPSHKLTCTNYGWFPMAILMTIEDGKYIDGMGIGATISGTMGSASIAVTDINRAIELLTAARYNVKPAQ